MREIVFFLFTLPLTINAGNLDKIRRTLEKADYDKVRELVDRAKEKEPDNPGVDFYASVLFSSKKYAAYNLDSARVFIQSSLEKLDQIDLNALEELAEDGVTKERIRKQNERVRDSLFDQLTTNMTLQAIYVFQYKYPMSVYDSVLNYKSDSIVFERTQEADSKDGYIRFIEEGKTPELLEKAKYRLDELRYNELIQNKNLQDYQVFLSKYPSTAFAHQVEEYILKRSTAGQEKEKYLNFIKSSSISSLKKRAGDILYYLSEKRNLPSGHPNLDSLKKIHEIQDKRLFPTIENGGFGFYSTKGELVIAHQFNDISDTFKCELTRDEWLFVSDTISKIISKNGGVILSDIQAYEDLGFGIAKVKKNEKWYIYHKSGFQILAGAVDDAEVLNKTWIKVKRRDRWGLFSFLGYEVAPFKYESIETLGPFWVFQKNRSYAVYNEELIKEDLDQKGLELEFRFHDLELINDNKLIGFRENRECMLDSALNFLIPWGIYQINPKPSGWYLKSDDGYRLYDQSKNDISNEIHPYLETNNGWLALKKSNGNWLLKARNESFSKGGYDSLKLINDYTAYAERNKARRLVFLNGDSIALSTGQKVKTLAKRPKFLLLEGKYGSEIIRTNGEKIVKGGFNELTFFNDSLIKANINGKYGLLKLQGGYLIKPEYQAIDEYGDLIMCLKGGKIGCYDPLREKWISTKYESRIERIGKNYLVKLEGMYGILDASNNFIIPNVYEEIKYWNDTTFLVKSDEWFFINNDQDQIGESFEYLSEIAKKEGESIYEYVKYGKYGLLSSKKGFLLEPEFSEILNLGDDKQPLFFADQNLKTAQMHVVSYVNGEGELIMSKAYRGEEFDKIICED